MEFVYNYFLQMCYCKCSLFCKWFAWENRCPV